MRQMKKLKASVYTLLQIVTTELKRGGRSYLFLDPTTQEPVLFEQKIYVRGKPWITSMSIKFRKFDKNPINPSVFQINESESRKV